MLVKYWIPTEFDVRMLPKFTAIPAGYNSEFNKNCKLFLEILYQMLSKAGP